jgi:hypothetical protein
MTAQQRLEQLTWESDRLAAGVRAEPPHHPRRLDARLPRQVQCAEGVIHLVVERAEDLSADLKLISGLDGAFPLQPGRGDEARTGGSGIDSRDPKALIRPRDLYEPDLRVETLKVKARNFR